MSRIELKLIRASNTDQLNGSLEILLSWHPGTGVVSSVESNRLFLRSTELFVSVLSFRDKRMRHTHDTWPLEETKEYGALLALFFLGRNC